MGAAKKTSLLVTRYSDGAAREFAFLHAHQLFLGFAKTDEDPSVPLLIDFEESRVLPAPKKTRVPETGALGSQAALDGLTAESTGSGVIEVRSGTGKLVRRLEKAGKRPLLRFADGGASLFSSATEALNLWSLKNGKAQKFKCHDRVTHVASIGQLIAAQNKEGVVSLFDARRGTRLVCVRPMLTGWIAFADDGAWDCSEGFTRGVELSWTDAKSTAFVPGEGFGWLELNRFPMTRVEAPTAGKTPGLIALRTRGFW